MIDTDKTGAASGEHPAVVRFRNTLSAVESYATRESDALQAAIDRDLREYIEEEEDEE